MEIAGSATELFQQAIQASRAGLGAAPAEAQEPAASFSETVVGAAQGAVESLAEAERLSGDMFAGKADPHSVVEALAAAELALQTAVTVRDKVVEAYQEILRMPV